MRRIRTTSVRVASLLIFILLTLSCTDEVSFEAPETVTVGFVAGNGATRTTMLPNGLSASWVAGDEIAVWAKNSSGSFSLSNQVFTTFGIDGGSGYFTSTLGQPMSDGTYTYYCCYPVPESVNGTQATFTIPSVQDGKVTSGADIMIATPVQHGALKPITDEDDNSTMSMRMNRMLHQFRFWIPSGMNTMGEDISRIEITMPDNIVGNLVADLSSPTDAMTLANGSNTVTLELQEPLGESDFDTFACAAVYANSTTYSSSDFMQVTLYSNSGKSVLDPIPLSGRKFEAGHSTPVRLFPKTTEIYCSVRIRTGQNYIGEPLANIRISKDGQELFTYSNSSGVYHNINYLKEYNGESEKASYEALVNAIAEGKAVLNFETEHASVDIPMTTDMMSRSGNSAELDLGDVPYLLFEDFSDAMDSAHDDDYTASAKTDTNLGGYLLNDYMSLDGWNASRYRIYEGDNIRINVRYQSGAWVVGRYCGRLDTPALKYLKSNTSTTIVFEFKYSFDVPSGYNVDDSKEKKAKYRIGTHTESEGSAIDGVTSGNISDKATIHYTSAGHADGDGGTVSYEMNVNGPSTRIVIFADTDQNSKKIGANSVYYLNIDNIKVYIKQ